MLWHLALKQIAHDMEAFHDAEVEAHRKYDREEYKRSLPAPK